MNNKLEEGFSYSFYQDALAECEKKFGGLFEQPIIKNPYTEIANWYEKGNILDLGAGKHKPLFNNLKNKLTDGQYYTLDDDPDGTFDFNRIEDIPQNIKFSLVVANQFFEHLAVPDSLHVMTSVAPLLEEGAKIIITVPNISHPNRQISNLDHKTAWGYNSFYTAYRYANLEVVKVARYSKRHPQGFMEKLITKYVSQVYRMDWCDSILMIGQKK